MVYHTSEWILSFNCFISAFIFVDLLPWCILILIVWYWNHVSMMRKMIIKRYHLYQLWSLIHSYFSRMKYNNWDSIQNINYDYLICELLILNQVFLYLIFIIIFIHLFHRQITITYITKHTITRYEFLQMYLFRWCLFTRVSRSE